ncbi:WD40-repeat-containing domain protein [Dipodascopsis tothii]|uniref:WD40-repeat-containing domain protein n=1 Tax=Dipodascopsis tothii TaxID=44089 RepID=UPI0034CFCBD4
MIPVGPPRSSGGFKFGSGGHPAPVSLSTRPSCRPSAMASNEFFHARAQTSPGSIESSPAFLQPSALLSPPTSSADASPLSSNPFSPFDSVSPATSLSSAPSPAFSKRSPRHYRRQYHKILSRKRAISPDRFIPSSSSAHLFHLDSPLPGASPQAPHSPTPGSSAGPARDRHESAIASALGIAGPAFPSRVLNFQGARPDIIAGGAVLRDRPSSITQEAMRLLDDAAAALPPPAGWTGGFTSSAGSIGSPNRHDKQSPFAPFRVLDAPGLRDDFYTNLLSWSPTTNDLAVGLGPEVYIWQEATGAVLLPEWSTSPVACVSFSPDGRTLVIGRMDGAITCWTVTAHHAKAEYFHTVGLCCISWRPPAALPVSPYPSSTSSTQQGTPAYNEFYVGDEVGEILQFKLLSDEIVLAINEPQLKLVNRIRGHSQQICGIAFNPTGMQMAVGANDNTCTVWDMEDRGPMSTPRYRWDHRAAVKALAYCPWSHALLATGGGSNDRTIRFWHTNSGALVKSINVNAQVTSLIWSRSTKEIVATFGYANPEHPIRMTIFSFPECRPISQVPWLEEIRCLYAVQSPGGGKVCAAASDETVRFYEFWEEGGQARVAHWDSGIYGSDILELCEGIEKNPVDSIR